MVEIARTNQSVLESAPSALSPLPIMQRMSGCSPYCGDRYEQIFNSVKDRLVWTSARRLAITAATYADREQRHAKLTEYIWTEYYGGVFIEDFLASYQGEHRKLLVRHASDEVRHGNAFAEYAGREHPSPNGSPECALSRDTYAAYQKWVAGDFDAFIAIIHVLELRTAMILTQWFQLLLSYPDDEHDVIRDLLSRIARDEVFHLTYTIQLLHERLSDDRVADLLEQAFLISEAGVAEIEKAAQQRASNLATAK